VRNRGAAHGSRSAHRGPTRGWRHEPDVRGLRPKPITHWNAPSHPPRAPRTGRMRFLRPGLLPLRFRPRAAARRKVAPPARSASRAASAASSSSATSTAARNSFMKAGVPFRSQRHSDMGRTRARGPPDGNARDHRQHLAAKVFAPRMIRTRKERLCDSRRPMMRAPECPRNTGGDTGRRTLVVMAAPVARMSGPLERHI
jgi:hypothetical protein